MKPDRPFQFPDIPDMREAFDLDVITARDVIDIDDCINSKPWGADYIGVPFVKNAQDIREVRDLLSIKGKHIKVFAKIQSREAVKNFDEILEEADGIVIARGFLATDLKIEEVTFVQKYLTKQCNKVGKPVVLSTQVIESMVKRTLPVMSEVQDITNAVVDGIDCIQLTAETCLGPFYVEAC
jgi:pyruvate kinase